MVGLSYLLHWASCCGRCVRSWTLGEKELERSWLGPPDPQGLATTLPLGLHVRGRISLLLLLSGAVKSLPLPQLHPNEDLNHHLPRSTNQPPHRLLIPRLPHDPLELVPHQSMVRVQPRQLLGTEQPRINELGLNRDLRREISNSFAVRGVRRDRTIVTFSNLRNPVSPKLLRVFALSSTPSAITHRAEERGERTAERRRYSRS